MTTIHISQDQTATVDATTDDDWIIDTGVTVATSGLGVDASGAIAGRDFTVLGTLSSTDGPAMTLGDVALVDSESTIRIDYLAKVLSGGTGLLAWSGHVHIDVVGDVNAAGLIETSGTSLDLRGDANEIRNDGTIRSTAGAAVVGTGSGNLVENNGTISARLDAITFSGGQATVTNNLVLSSTRGHAAVLSGTGNALTNNDRITARLDAVVSSGADAEITNTDTIESLKGAGIASSGDHATIVSTTLVRGATSGILSTGDNAAITNSGTVRSAGTGIRADGANTVIDTSSQLTGKVALVLGGDGSLATNLNEIHGTSKTDAAIRITATGGADFTNNGAVYAKSGEAILAGRGDDSIDNTGSLYGHVRLGAGDDWFRSDVGEVTGKIFGGRGDDIYEAGIKLRIVELAGQGNDTVKAAFTWTLGANLENLELTGAANADGIGNRRANILTGNEGDNRLTGGAGRDIFAFATGGHDTIMDFRDGADLIDFRNLADVDGFGDISAHMTQVGRNVVIDLSTLDDALVLTIRRMDLDHLTADDFLF